MTTSNVQDTLDTIRADAESIQLTCAFSDPSPIDIKLVKERAEKIRQQADELLDTMGRRQYEAEERARHPKELDNE